MARALEAMLEAIESNSTTFDVFLAHIVVPNTAKAIGDQIVPKLKALYDGAPLRVLLAETPE